MAKELFEIKKNNEGFGYLIEKDAGFIDPKINENVKSINELNSSMGMVSDVVEIADRMRIYLVLQKYGIENANGRIYPESVLRKQVELYKRKIADRRAYGELNHPESVTIDGDRLAFGLTEVHWEGRTLMGTGELIMSPGFVKHGVISCVGDKVANYLRLGWKIGVSSRGLGSVEKDRFSGKFIVQDDFELTCFDLVSDPSTANAWINTDSNNLKPYVESKQTSKTIIIEGLDNFLNKNKRIII